MGFDLSRFIGEIDEEFQCSICSMVLENPVQSPCDHLFCSECIEKWLSSNPSCPVDREPLANTDLKPINRSLRNLLSKLEIKCDFDSQGCNAAIKLEGLQGHIASCEYHPDVLIVCDKGCNLQMSRREYRTSNCFTHLAVDHKKEIAALAQELANQKEHLDRQKEHSARQGEEIGRLSNEMIQLSNEVTQIRREKDQLEGVTTRLEEENKKLSDEVHQLRQQQNPSEASTQRQEQEIANFKDGAEISSNAPMKWALMFNVKSPFDQPDILVMDDESAFGSVRSFHALEPKNSSFKVEVLSGNWFAVRLSFKEQTNPQFGNWFASYSGFVGSLDINDVIEYRGPICEIGDIVELGIKFPINFVNDGNVSVELYLSINERVVKEKLVKMPIDAIYPTINIYSRDTKIKYFGI